MGASIESVNLIKDSQSILDIPDIDRLKFDETLKRNSIRDEKSGIMNENTFRQDFHNFVLNQNKKAHGVRNSGEQTHLAENTKQKLSHDKNSKSMKSQEINNRNSTAKAQKMVSIRSSEMTLNNHQ